MKKIIDFPILRQTYGYDCGASAIQGVLDYYGIDIREEMIMKISSTNKKGTTIKGLKKVAKYFDLSYTERKMNIDDLKKYVDKKIPVIIALQAWSEDKNKDLEKDWKDGHYVVVIGYSKNRIYFADPSSESKTFLFYKELEKRWHDQDIKGKKIINWGIAIYRFKKSKKNRKWFCIDYWSKKFKPGTLHKKITHMD